MDKEALKDLYKVSLSNWQFGYYTYGGASEITNTPEFKKNYYLWEMREYVSKLLKLIDAVHKHWNTGSYSFNAASFCRLNQVFEDMSLYDLTVIYHLLSRADLSVILAKHGIVFHENSFLMGNIFLLERIVYMDEIETICRTGMLLDWVRASISNADTCYDSDFLNFLVKNYQYDTQLDVAKVSGKTLRLISCLDKSADSEFEKTEGVGITLLDCIRLVIFDEDTGRYVPFTCWAGIKQIMSE